MVFRHINTLISDQRIIQFLNSRQYDEPFDCVAPTEPGVAIRIRVIPYRQGQHILQARDVTQVKGLEQVRRDFVANASHELRTPISIIYGYLDMLLQAEQDEIGSQWKPAISQMHIQTTRVKQIIEDMMMLSRLEDTDLGEEHQFIEIRPLLESAAKNAKILSGEKSHIIQTEIQGDYHLNGSEKELESLISNLVSNAVRYTPEKGKIRVKWQVDAENGTLSVIDTGIGIDKEDIPRITERFYRTDSARSRETGGTGLGLAIVNHIINRHQAVLEIQSELGKGSRFKVVFPANRIRKDPKLTDLMLQ